MTNLDLVVALATQPRKAFEELAARPRFWFPLLLAVVLGAASTFWYYQVADINWVIDQTLNANPRTAQMSEAQRAQAAQFMSPATLKWSGTIAAALIVALIHVIGAVYYVLAGKVVNLQQSFKHWFALSTWSALPTLLGILPTAVVLLTTTNGQIDTSAMSPLSLNELFFHRKMGEPGYTMLLSLTLLQPLAWLLAIIGIQEWSKRSWLFSTVFALLPSVLIYGIWAWIAF
jgi:hypothetical protein